MNRWGRWIVGAALVAAAWGVTLLAPASTAWRTPYLTAIEFGEVQTAGNLTVQVHEAYFADEVVDPQPSGIWTGSGNFLVLDVSAQTHHDESVNRIVSRTAILDGREYWPTERVFTQLSSASLSAAMATRGTLVYELPPEGRSGTIQVQLGAADAKQAGQIVQIEITLDDLIAHDSVRLEKTRWEPAL